ncbi:hypothetical protein DFH06DRAFT_1226619 [Mycena polygramma]|nr:hypothetical protein DFH06DRAFT_1226619 [Mycena polygramma]
MHPRPPERIQSAQPAYPARQVPTQRPSGKYPAPCIKYPTAYSTRATRGAPTVREYESDDDETVGAGTTTSIASSKSRAPGNTLKQHRRVKDWVADTSQQAPKFKSPFVPRSGTSHTHSSANSNRKSDRRERHDSSMVAKREPPPIWIPQQPAHRPVRHADSQPALFQQSPAQYFQPQGWTPTAPPPIYAPARGNINGHVRFDVSPSTVTNTPYLGQFHTEGANQRSQPKYR